MAADPPPFADPNTLALQAATNVLPLATKVLGTLPPASTAVLSNALRSASQLGSNAASAQAAVPVKTSGPRFADPAALTRQAATDVFRPATNVVGPLSPIPSVPSSSAVPTVSQAGTTNPPPTGHTNSMDALDDKHILAIGDRLSFRIEEDQEDPKQLVITDSGELEAPYIGRFPAENKTCKQLARELKTALEKEYYYQATVIIAVDVMAKSRGRVYLVGPVRMPGPQEIPSDEVLTISKAILRAGGFTDFADKKNVKITRKGALDGGEKETLVVNVANILEKGQTEADVPLQAGDLIYIPERTIRF